MLWSGMVSWVTVIWSMVASACLTLAAIHSLIWYRNRAAWAHLLFAVTSASTAALAFYEFRLMRAETPGEILAVLTWAHVPLFFWLVSITWFVRIYLGAGRLWLAWTITGLRAFSLLANLLMGQNLSFRNVTSVRHIQFLGESVTVVGAVPNTLTPITQFATLLILIFVADATVAAWRRGDRRKALMVGGSVEFFILAGLGSASAAIWGNIQLPIVFSLFYLGLCAVMGYELSDDVLRSSQLARELQVSEAGVQRLRQEIAHAGRVSMMGQLASALAHEINQPLATILRNAEAAELFLQDPSPDLDEVRAILSDIRKDDERAGDVIDRMRGLLKRQTLDTRRLDLGAVVDDVAALVRVDAATRRVKLDVNLPDDLPQVRGDRVHLQQVLLNLVLNGMDALNGAGPDQRRVTVTARVGVTPRGQQVEITVADAGHGIPADALEHIFDPFFTTKADGMGMGLAISRTIIDAHGGRLWAENKNGGGAAFRFTLPIAEQAATV